MVKDVTSQLLGAKRKESVWSENAASRMAYAVAEILEGHVEWDGVACEDWISIEEGKKEDEPIFFFLYAYMPLILTSKKTIDRLPMDILGDCEVIVFDKYQEKELRAEKGVINQVFRTTRGMEEDEMTIFSANNLYFHTV